jgi:hypothetical protein
MKKIAVVVAAVIASACVVAATPSFALDSGTITGTVIPAAPCVTFDTSSLDFGALPFSDRGHAASRLSPPIDVTNCYGGTSRCSRAARTPTAPRRARRGRSGRSRAATPTSST